MLQVMYETEGRTQVFTLSKDVAFIGRANDNDIVLNDFSVSRRHAFLKKEKDGWVIYDNQSTNGVRVNDQAVPQADVRDGDQALIGTFVLRFRDDPTGGRKGGRLVDSTSTRIRPIAEFNQDFGLEKSDVPLSDSTAQRRRAALDVAYKNRVFEILVQVAKALISADDLSSVLDKVMDLIFEFLPADRGYPAARRGRRHADPLRLALQDDEEAHDLRQLDAVLPDDRGHGREAEGRDPDLGRADGRALRERRLDPAAADPLGDVRSALERRGGHRRRLRRLARCTRGASRSRTSTC